MNINKSLLKNIIVYAALLASVQSVFAQTGVAIIPATEIMSAPVGTVNAPVAMAVVPLANSGAWANQGGGPAIYSKSMYYYLQINPVGVIPANATITSVSWSWGLSYKPAGLLTYLCHDTTSACIDVTNLQSGSTSSFYNLAANKKMLFAFLVQGTGTMSPAYGQLDQVIVTYQY